jgi:hypothetical protein
MPNELKQTRTYRTRPDPFASDSPELEAMAHQAPSL